MKTKTEFRQFCKIATSQELKNKGFRIFDTINNYELYLIPAKYYNIIPNGYNLIAISGKPHKFKFGITNDDQRYGLLAYGILRKK